MWKSLPYRRSYVLDFEFSAPSGELPRPLCVCAKELQSGVAIRKWLEDDQMPPYDLSDNSTLSIAYYSSAEWGCHEVLGLVEELQQRVKAIDGTLWRKSVAANSTRKNWESFKDNISKCHVQELLGQLHSIFSIWAHHQPLIDGKHKPTLLSSELGVTLIDEYGLSSEDVHSELTKRGIDGAPNHKALERRLDRCRDEQLCSPYDRWGKAKTFHT